MKIRTVYTSALGRDCDTAADAMTDEDRLPGIIASYEASLHTLQVGDSFAGQPGPHSPGLIEEFANAVAGYKTIWAEVRAQRGLT